MTWYDDGGNTPPHEPTLNEARTILRDRARCPVCNQWPKLTNGGALHNHSYPWYHSRNGEPCPGGGTQIAALPGQLGLEDL